jgi:hypothetical protein
MAESMVQGAPCSRTPIEAHTHSHACFGGLCIPFACRMQSKPWPLMVWNIALAHDGNKLEYILVLLPRRTVRVFERVYTRGCHWFTRLLASRQASRRMPWAYDQWPCSRVSTFLPFHSVNCVQTLKAQHSSTNRFSSREWFRSPDSQKDW